MGLRINTNVSAIKALRNLNINDKNQSRSLERLSTGLRINRASDDPSGLVISEQLRSQLSSLQQAVDNSETASNMLSIADMALQNLANELTGIKDSIVFAMNEGGTTPAQLSAEQDAVDAAVSAIDRIAATTRFADRSLLNGKGDFLVSAQNTSLNDLKIRTAQFAQGVTSQTFNINVTASAVRGAVQIGSTASGTVIRIMGPKGTQDINVASQTRVGVASAINKVASFTGVFASAGLVLSGQAAASYALTQEFGVIQTVQIEVVSGTAQLGAGSGAAAGNVTEGNRVTNRGKDGKISFAGATYTGNGRSFSVNSANVTMSFSIDPANLTPALAGTGAYSFTVRRSGLNFQLNETSALSDGLRVGLENMTTGKLGSEAVQDVLARAANGGVATTKMGGYLNSLKRGGANDLATKPQNALNIVDAAIDQVSSLRGYLGAVGQNVLEPNISAIDVEMENLSAAYSRFKDLDFAKETANFTRTQILYQAGTAVLASANLIPQTVLTLLR